MKKIFVLLICLMCVVGCTKEDTTDITYKTISSEEAYTMMKENSDVIILDVRTEEEYSSGHIENAVNVPLNIIETAFSSLVTDDKDAVILVYCQSGNRSKQASDLLVGMGYKNIYNFGGISSWNYDVVK